MTKINYAATSIKQVPALFKKVYWMDGTTNLDIGGGKYDLGSEYLSTKGVMNLILDPYCRSEIQNRIVTNLLSSRKVNTVTISNLLCVIKSKAERGRILRSAKNHLRKNGLCYISIYEGDKSGIGKKTTINTWQNNKKLHEYYDEITKIFFTTTIRNGIIIATR